MGLDMYLYIDKYVSRMEYTQPEATLRPEFQVITDILGVSNLIQADDWTGYTVQVPVGYWRKANAIHNWIVTFCADGVDNCQRIYVPREKAQELVDLCKQVLETKDETYAREMLSPAQGFFFGSYNIDEYYYHDLQHTIDIFEPLLASEYADSIGYQASW